eukprot:611670-Prorocentrum_lima.AAC.1
MTSSLVGSEMCIRDSFNGTPAGRLAVEVQRVGCRVAPGRLQVAILKNPVSYTHLTLPTICSV